MSRRLPLGRKEDFHLEFKGRDALDEPDKIAREIVAFLNAKGGEVWVGLGEEDGRAVKVEPIPDPERAQRRLLDSLIETVEPSPSAEEVWVEVVDEGEGAVLRVSAQPDERRQPYAFLRKGGRHFVLRIGDRIRPMSREEIFKTKLGGGDERVQPAIARVLSERSERQEQRKEVLWLRLEPAPEVELDLQERRIEEILQDPEQSRNRPDGWTFARFQRRPVLRSGRLVTSPEDDYQVAIRRQGGVAFSAPLESLLWKGEAHEIWPPILCELPISALRIAAALYEGFLASDAEIVIDFALIGLEGWTLRPGTPGTWFSSNPCQKFGGEDFLLDRPLVVPARALFENPDAIGYRLVERVYEAFGLRREQMPQAFDPVTRRLVLPS